MGRKKLTERERFYIEKSRKKKVPVSQIARDLECSRQTIYNELQRGEILQTDGMKDFYCYDYYAGQRRCDMLAKNKGRKRKLNTDDPYLIRIAEWIKKKKYSPQAALYKCGNKLCVRSLYNYVYAGLIPGVTIRQLPYAKPKKKKNHNVGKRKWDKGTSIELRPESVNERSCPGHWEMDTVYSSKDDLHCLLVLTERMKRKEIMIRMKNRTAGSVVKALDALERKMGSPAFRAQFKTITCDNGVEFSSWRELERSCRSKLPRTKIYFCHPYCSWERGTNENMNRMIRRWIPKGDDIGLWSPREIQKIQDWINDYPRPMFGGLSAREYEESVI